MTDNPYTRFRNNLARWSDSVLLFIAVSFITLYSYAIGLGLVSGFVSGFGAYLLAIPAGALIIVGIVLAAALLLAVVLGIRIVIALGWKALENRWERKHGRNQD